MSVSALVTRYRLPAQTSFGNASRSWHERAGLLLTLESDAGSFGQGEAAPLPGYSDDELESSEQELTNLEPSELARLIECGFAEPSALLQALGERRIPVGSAARFALETALCDLVARRRGEPLHVFLRQAYAADVAPLAPLPLAALLEPGPLLAPAERALAEGFLTLKAKIGGPDAASELRELRTLRGAFGDNFSLRLDANRSLSLAAAEEWMSEIAWLGIEFIEEPTYDLTGLREPPIPVALDESLRSSTPLEPGTLRLQGVTTWIIKPSVLHGISASAELALRARSQRFDVVFSHLFEGPVGFAAVSELALALGASPRAHGLARYPLLDAWGTAAPARSPLLSPHQRPGLGIERVYAVTS
jgi:o-succinylbenzoate synthase